MTVPYYSALSVYSRMNFAITVAYYSAILFIQGLYSAMTVPYYSALSVYSRMNFAITVPYYSAMLFIQGV